MAKNIRISEKNHQALKAYAKGTRRTMSDELDIILENFFKKKLKDLSE